MTLFELSQPARTVWRGRRNAKRAWLLAILATSSLASMLLAAVFVAP